LEGTRPTGLYCINFGKVKVFKRGAAGREQIVRLTKPGDVLGYRSLIGNELYAASAESLEETSICFIPKNVFFDLISQNKDFVMVMMKKLATELGNAERNVTELAQKPVKKRLAETLLMLLNTYGLNDDGASIDVNLTRRDIANIAGTSTETIIRLLSKFKKEQLIHVQGRKIQILDKQRLIRKANFFD